MRQNPSIESLLADLATDGTWYSDLSVHISHEGVWVHLNCADVEILASVNTVGVRDTSRERSHEAALGDAFVVANVGWVRESEAWWARRALSCLVDVGSGRGRRGVICVAKAGQDDFVADEVFFRIEGEVVEAFGAGLTAGWGGTVDDLVRSGDYMEGRGELGVILFSLAPILVDVGSG